MRRRLVERDRGRQGVVPVGRFEPADVEQIVRHAREGVSGPGRRHKVVTRLGRERWRGIDPQRLVFAQRMPPDLHPGQQDGLAQLAVGIHPAAREQ